MSCLRFTSMGNQWMCGFCTFLFWWSLILEKTLLYFSHVVLGDSPHEKVLFLKSFISWPLKLDPTNPYCAVVWYEVEEAIKPHPDCLLRMMSCTAHCAGSLEKCEIMNWCDLVDFGCCKRTPVSCYRFVKHLILMEQSSSALIMPNLPWRISKSSKDKLASD